MNGSSGVGDFFSSSFALPFPSLPVISRPKHSAQSVFGAQSVNEKLLHVQSGDAGFFLSITRCEEGGRERREAGESDYLVGVRIRITAGGR